MLLVANLRKQFGKRLRDLRTEKGFNQLYLGTLAGVSEDFISLVERGINTPSFETIESLAAALETTVTALFTFPGEQHDRQRVRMVKSKKAAARKKIASPPNPPKSPDRKRHNA
jgi:transcriptional regulator with XRE-family HTH domain